MMAAEPDFTQSEPLKPPKKRNNSGGLLTRHHKFLCGALKSSALRHNSPRVKAIGGKPPVKTRLDERH
jgi:hypothetical protein